jgi:hypothetical protein
MPGGWYDRALLTKLDVMPRPMPPEQPSYQVHRRSTRHRRVVCERPAQTSLQSELERHDQMHRALLAARARAGGIGPNVLHALSPRRSPRRLDPLASLLDSRRSPSHSRGGDAVRANAASHTRVMAAVGRPSTFGSGRSTYTSRPPTAHCFAMWTKRLFQVTDRP